MIHYKEADIEISFILNGEDVIIHSKANVRLVDILRYNFGLLKTKTGCLCGKCGFCSVLFNGSICLACLIPAFKLQRNEIITIEGFSNTNEYQDIVKGFSAAGLKPCGYCINSKILVTSALLEKSKHPEKKEILHAFGGIKCRCSEPEKLLQAIEKASDIRHRRFYDK